MRRSLGASRGTRQALRARVDKEMGRPQSRGMAAELDQAALARLATIQAAAKSGGLAAAVPLAEAALADGLRHPLLYSLLAAAREAEGDLDAALALLRQAKAIAPGAANVLNGVGLYLARLGDHAAAMAEYDAALAADPRFAKALANRGMALIALSRLREAARDFEAALALDPGHRAAAIGLATLALRRGETGEARRLAGSAPGLPAAALIVAEAAIAEGEAAQAEAALRALSGGGRIGPLDEATAKSLLGDALDKQGRFAEAFEAWREANALLRRHYAGRHGGRTIALVRALTDALEGKRFAPGAGAAGPARRHVFLLGFPRSGTTLIEQVLEEHDEIVTLPERECLAEASRDWLAGPERLAALCAADAAALDPYRAAYWQRVREEGVEPAGRVFVDKNPFNSFRLPLIARLFPDALILFARRDPRDIVLSCFRQRFAMSDAAYELLTLEGAAALYGAAMAMAAASERAFGYYMHPAPLEAMIADFDGETRAICAFLGVEWHEGLRDFAAHVAARAVATPSGPQLVRGLNARGIGKWRDYETEMAPILPLLEPWVERFGYA